MTRTATNDPVLIATAERRRFVLDLRKTGANYRDIAAAAIRRFGWERLPVGWDCRYAYKDVKREIAKLQKEIQGDAETIRALELERLDTLLYKLWLIVHPPKGAQLYDIKTQFEALDRILKIMTLRLRYVPDLEAPIPVEGTITVIGGIDLDKDI